LLSKDNIIRRVLMGKKGGSEKFGTERGGKSRMVGVRAGGLLGSGLGFVFPRIAKSL
jgi:hypothetical protein